MKNLLKAALVLGTLGTPMVAFAGDPAVPADKAPAKDPTVAPKDSTAPVGKTVEPKKGDKKGDKKSDTAAPAPKDVKAN